mgnify:CR=1 FL=1
MAIITISHGPCSKGKEVAEEVAKRLHFPCISREILMEASEEFNIPENKLLNAMHDSPTFLDRYHHGRERYLGYCRYELLKHAFEGDFVYHGVAGHYLLRALPQVLKVRIIADMQARVEEYMVRNPVSESEAKEELLKNDEIRRQWSLRLYGTDTWDTRLYDMVLQVNRLQVSDIVDMVCMAAEKPIFKRTKEAEVITTNLYLSAKIQSMLMKLSFMIEVKVENGVATLSNVGEVLRGSEVLRAKIQESVEAVEGINQVVFADENLEKSEYINTFYKLASKIK